MDLPPMLPGDDSPTAAPGGAVVLTITKSASKAEDARGPLEKVEVQLTVDADVADFPTTVASLPLPTPKHHHLLYALHDQPPAVVLLLLAVQHCFLALLHCLLVLDSLSTALCLHSEDPARAQLLCRLLLLCGLGTLANNTPLGLGLGLIQSPCVASIGAALLVADYGQDGDVSCPSMADQYAMGLENMKLVWQPRARRVQAAILIASALSAALAAAGLPRLVARFQTPITAAVATFLSALPLVGYAVNAAAPSWTGALSGALGVLLCGLALRRVSVPVAVCSVRRGGLGARMLPAMSLLAVLLPLWTGWATCGLLTATGILATDPGNHLVTSEWRQDRVHAGDVFAVPWPVPWGWPSLSGVPWTVVTSSVVAALVANIASNLTTFYAAGASSSGGDVPDGRSLQQGCLVVSAVAFLGALLGVPALVGGGQETVGVVPLTQAGPVTAARLSALLLLVVSFFPALAAGLASIPLPLLAGVGLAVLGAGAGQGLKYLRSIDLKSARNCGVLGISVLTGLCVAGRLGLPALPALSAGSAGPAEARLEAQGGHGVDAVAAAVVAAGPLAGAALSLVLEAVLPQPRPRPPALT